MYSCRFDLIIITNHIIYLYICYIYILLYTSEIYSRFLEWFWRIKYCHLQLFVLFDIRFFLNQGLPSQNSRDIFGSQKCGHGFGCDKIETRAIWKGSFSISKMVQFCTDKLLVKLASPLLLEKKEQWGIQDFPAGRDVNW